MMTEERPQQQTERQTAKIVSIREMETGRYVKQEGWLPNYVLTRKNEKVSRVNVIGVIVTVPDNADSVFIDDGSGKIEVRSFEDRTLFKDVTIGDIVLVIGKPREYGSKIYINCEILRKVTNKDWLEYRKKEILLKNIVMPDMKDEGSVAEADELPIADNAGIDIIDEVLVMIKESDKGDGCNIQELVAKEPRAEEIVQTLLLKGEVFELSPGKIKILE